LPDRLSRGLPPEADALSATDVSVIDAAQFLL
jgi:hypothetical protein